MEVESYIRGRDFPVPAEQRYFEDYVPGSVFEYGAIRLDEPDIIAFGRQYAPYSRHVDPDAAARVHGGGLTASAAQTIGVTMRLLVDHFLSKVASLASPGSDEIRFHRPVRPQDVLRIRVTVLQAKRSVSKHDRGVVWNRVELLNQNDQLVMSMTSIDILRCRESEASSRLP